MTTTSAVRPRAARGKPWSRRAWSSSGPARPVVRSSQRLRWHLSEFERPDHTVLTTSDAGETDIESQGHDPTRQDLQVEQITPPASVATRLNLDPRTDVCVVRRHVRYIDGKPAIISDDYFDERIVRGTELAEPEDTTRENILAEWL